MLFYQLNVSRMLNAFCRYFATFEKGGCDSDADKYYKNYKIFFYRVYMNI